MGGVGYGLDEFGQGRGGRHSTRLICQPYKREVRCAGDHHIKVELTFSGSDLRNVDVEVAVVLALPCRIWPTVDIPLVG